jgi:signal transduction histidine kinase
VEVARDGAEAVLTVSDDGANIDPDDLPFIFERFYRGATGKGAPGVGLGLAIVRGLVRAHGGSVQAAPRQGGGATFTVRLPALPPRESESKSGGNGRSQ